MLDGCSPFSRFNLFFSYLFFLANFLPPLRIPFEQSGLCSPLYLFFPYDPFAERLCSLVSTVSFDHGAFSLPLFPFGFLRHFELPLSCCGIEFPFSF